MDNELCTGEFVSNVLYDNLYNTYHRRYHIVGTVPKSNRKTRDITLSEQFQDQTEKQEIPHCRNSSEI